DERPSVIESRRAMLRGMIAAGIAGTGGLLMASCGKSAEGLSPKIQKMLDSVDIQASTIVEAVTKLDQHPGARPLSLSASVEPDRVIFTQGDETAEASVPTDQFYLAIAPYRSQTHDCFYHN